jgi:hypothetical protein
MLNSGKDILAETIRNPLVLNRDMEFYYSRDSRLARASQTVKDMNEGKIKRPSIFGSLTSTRSHRMTFISIIVLCAAISVIGKVVSNESSYSLGKNSITASALRYEGKTFVVLKKTARDGAYSGAVNVAISPDKTTEKDWTIFTELIYFMPEPSEEFRMAIPLEVEHLLLLLQNETERLAIRIKVE